MGGLAWETPDTKKPRAAGFFFSAQSVAWSLAQGCAMGQYAAEESLAAAQAVGESAGACAMAPWREAQAANCSASSRPCLAKRQIKAVAICGKARSGEATITARKGSVFSAQRRFALFRCYVGGRWGYLSRTERQTKHRRAQGVAGGGWMGKGQGQGEEEGVERKMAGWWRWKPLLGQGSHAREEGCLRNPGGVVTSSWWFSSW